MREFGEILATANLDFRADQLVWSPDGRWIGAGQASMGWELHDRTAPEGMVVLDATTGEEHLDFGDLIDTESIAFSPDGNRLARAGWQRTWVEPDLSTEPEPGDLRPGEPPPPPPEGHYDTWFGTMTRGLVSTAHNWKQEGLRGNLVYSPNSQLLSVSDWKKLHVLDADTGGTHLGIDSFSSRPLPGRFTKDSRWLATADSERMVLIDVTTKAVVWTTPLPDIVAEFAFAEDDSNLVASTERKVFVLDAISGAVRASVDLQDPLLRLPTVLSPDCRQLARAGEGSMVLWNVADGIRCFDTSAGSQPRVRFNPALPEIAIASGSGLKVVNTKAAVTVWEHATDPVIDLAFSPDGRQLAVCGGPRRHSGFIRIHDMNPTSVSHRVHRGPVTRIALTSAPNPLAVTASQSPEAMATIFRATTGELVLEKIHPGVITSLKFSPDGRHFATGSTDGGARLFEALSGDKRWHIPHNASVNGLAFVPPSGTSVVTAGGDKTARLINRDTGEERWKSTHPQAVTMVTASPDGRWIATACADRSTRILSPDTGVQLFCFPHDGKIRAMAFSLDGSVLATGGEDGVVLIINAATGQQLGRSVHTRAVTAVGFSHDGSFLATAGKDQRVHLFDLLANPPALDRELTFSKNVIALAFHPAELQLALVTEAPTPAVMIINPADGTEISRLAHPTEVHDLAYSPDGQLLATACEDTLARVYPGRRGS